MAKLNKKTMDGNTAAAYVSYAFTDVAVIYPITPSSTMAELVDEWSAKGKKNIFGQTVRVVEMQSEAGASGTLHGSLQGGSLTSTYTASQGLLLMIPNMYKIAGELLPAVFHVSSRSLSSNTISIFGDHQDVMATRQTGFALLASSSVQQAMDLGAVAHLSAIKSRVPFLHFFDGFRTSHEIQKIDILDYNDLAKLVDMQTVSEFRHRSLNPDHPVIRGTTQNSDTFFQYREAITKFYPAILDTVENYMQEINKLTGRNYQLFNYYGASDADRIVIAMGSGCDAIRETINYLNTHGEKVGLVEVHLYRPFSAKHLLKVMPASVKKIAVLDRTKEPGAEDPLYLDVRNAFFDQKNVRVIVSGRYGIAGKDFTPRDIAAIYENLKTDKPRTSFTVSINDDVNFSSLPQYKEDIDTTPEGTKACKFWGFGSDGTVSANKSAVKIIGNHTDMYAQAYFAYDSKKSGGLTVSHLRFGKQPIQSSYLITKADFIACHNQAYVTQYDLLAGLKPGGIFLLNCTWNKEELEENLPAAMKRYIAVNNIRFYTINAVDIAEQLGLQGRINMIMQAAFFKLVSIISIEEAVRYLKEAVVTSYGRQGQKIIDLNNAAVDRGICDMVQIEVPETWKNAQDEASDNSNIPEFVKKVLIPMNRQEGDNLPVSTWNGREDGTFPIGLTAWEKRGIALNVPQWQPAKCLQCNQCSFVCPHAVIRPKLVSNDELKNAPAGFAVKAAIGMSDLKYHLAISAMDCTGCGNCIDICPAKEKALVMKPLSEQRPECEKLWDFACGISNKPISAETKLTVKGSQFIQPLFEFPVSCAGCGETSYAKLITQLVGDRMMISNAAGCSTVWSSSVPSVPYVKNEHGHGPAWAFSLFEDCAEYGFGMHIGVSQMRQRLAEQIQQALKNNIDENLKAVMEDWLTNKDEGENTRQRAARLTAALEAGKGNDALLNEIYEYRDFFVKRSQWIFGGDGWAYDIGYGGLDHVLASDEDVNVMVFDTEVYSNTGGQSSKSTPTAATAKFASSGKRTCKKDLGRMAMSYGYVYVAQIAMGADKNQTLKVMAEAEAYHGPSLIIAYAPCVNHGIRGGMTRTQTHEKEAVECGYWILYHYNPQLKEAGKNPFILDSKEPTGSFQDFIKSEVRYTALQRQFPEIAQNLFDKAEKDAKDRLKIYKQLAAQ